MILLFVPAASRLWCARCPIPASGEWLQRRAFIQPRLKGKLYTLGWKWPKRLNGMWLQNAALLGVALFSAVILATPSVSGWVLAAFIFYHWQRPGRLHQSEPACLRQRRVPTGQGAAGWDGDGHA